MALVGYESSDEDEEISPQPVKQSQVEGSKISTTNSQGARDVSGEHKGAGVPPVEAAAKSSNGAQAASPSRADKQATEPRIGPSLPSDAATIGPALPAAEADLEYPMDMEDDDAAGAQPPASPYSANRALLRDLTLPTAPNLDIPPSPPGSPPPGLNAKFDQFLDLKRKKGTHFNARVAQSAALKNPALMDKLLGFVGMDPNFDDGNDIGTAQYATTLPSDLWDPKGFPEWAFRGQLRRSQERVQKDKARGTGQGVEFVPASTSESSRQAGSRSGTPQKVTGKRKSRFDLRD